MGLKGKRIGVALDGGGARGPRKIAGDPESTTDRSEDQNVGARCASDKYLFAIVAELGDGLLDVAESGVGLLFLELGQGWVPAAHQLF